LAASLDSVNTTREGGRSNLFPLFLSGQKKFWNKNKVHLESENILNQRKRKYITDLIKSTVLP
jgi:hypothetical protein